VTEGLNARLKTPLGQRADCSEVLASTWADLSAGALAQRRIELEHDGPVQMGELFDISGSPGAVIRFTGDLTQADRLGAGMSQGLVIVEGSVGNEAGLGMMGGALDITGNAGARAGAAAPGVKRGMSGGELIVRGSAGPETGASMRRGLLVVGGDSGPRTGLGIIAGTIVVFGASGADSGLWSKRGSVIAFGDITPPATYLYACTYRPVHLRLMLMRLQTTYGLRVRKRQLQGLYRRYSGDLAELGKGEILQWTAT
jgi:formylmethanofuran dehydrogenase subunit C